MQDGREECQSQASEDKPEFPAWCYPDDTAEDEESPYVELTTIGPADADRLCAQLESAGIPSRIEPNVPPGTPPPTALKLLVREVDLVSARETMANPPETADEELFNQDEYLERDLCPRCHERALETLPPSGRWRHMRIAWRAALGAFAVLLLTDIFGPPDLSTDTRETLYRAHFVLLFIVFGLWALHLVLPRNRRCTSCGWELNESKSSA